MTWGRKKHLSGAVRIWEHFQRVESANSPVVVDGVGRPPLRRPMNRPFPPSSISDFSTTEKKVAEEELRRHSS